MKKWCQLLALVALGLSAGCGNSHVTVKPNEKTMIGTWVPHKTKSTCLPTLISETTQLVLKQDKIFQAQNFPKGISLGRLPSVGGQWGLKKEGNRWSSDLPWETPSMSILDGAQLIKADEDLFIEFWIGDPDDYSRLVMRKRVKP